MSAIPIIRHTPSYEERSDAGKKALRESRKFKWLPYRQWAKKTPHKPIPGCK